MKTIYLFIACCLLLLQGTAPAAGEEYIRGEIVSSFADRIDLSLGDKVIVNLGRAQGIAKGDIGKISRRAAEDPLSNTQGQCAVVETEDAAAVCEIIQSKFEMHRGDSVFMKGLEPGSDPALMPLALQTLQSIVEPHAAHKKLSVYVYNIFSPTNDVTALSESIRREIAGVLRQKSRIKFADSSTTIEAFYPEPDMQWAADIRRFMKKSHVDALVTGSYAIENDQVLITVYKIDVNGDDRRITFAVPAQQVYRDLASEIRIPYQSLTKKEQVYCYFQVKPFSYAPPKDEKQGLIRFEADGNPFTEYSLRRDDFNIVSPVDITVKVDNEVFVLSAARPQQLVTLSRGMHRVSASFRRGYFFNETLLYRSKNLLTKEALLDVTKSTNVLVDFAVNPLPDQQPITLQVFDSVGKERQVLRPIRRLDADRLVETFKD